MTAQAVFALIKRRANRSGLPNFSPHDLRRTFISDMLDTGANLSTVQQLAGHAQVQTTARYDRCGQDAKRKAVARLYAPFRGRQAAIERRFVGGV